MQDNLRNLGLDAIDIVNLRVMVDIMVPPRDRSRQVTAMAELQAQGLVRTSA